MNALVRLCKKVYFDFIEKLHKLNFGVAYRVDDNES